MKFINGWNIVRTVEIELALPFNSTIRIDKNKFT